MFRCLLMGVLTCFLQRCVFGPWLYRNCCKFFLLNFLNLQVFLLIHKWVSSFSSFPLGVVEIVCVYREGPHGTFERFFIVKYSDMFYRRRFMKREWYWANFFAMYVLAKLFLLFAWCRIALQVVSTPPSGLRILVLQCGTITRRWLLDPGVWIDFWYSVFDVVVETLAITP